MGFTNFDDDNKVISRRRVSETKPEKDSIKLHTDLTRLLLLIFMLLAALLGGYIKTVTNKPTNVLEKSIDKSLKQSFKASMEGSTVIKDSTVCNFRSRQIYTPETGLSILSSIRSSDRAPFDAVSAIESLRLAGRLTEYNKEDMYGHPTRHFSGTINPARNDSSVVCIFEYWIDMKSFLAVRLSIARVERNVSTDTSGNPLSKETYINIRYHDWRKIKS